MLTLFCLNPDCHTSFKTIWKTSLNTRHYSHSPSCKDIDDLKSNILPPASHDLAMNLSLSIDNITNDIESESNVTFSNMSYSFLADTSLDMSPTNEAIHPTLRDNSFYCMDLDQEGENDKCFMNDLFEIRNASDLLSAMNGDTYSRDEVSEKDVPVDVVDTYLTMNPEHATTSPNVYNDLSSSSCSPDIDCDSVISSPEVSDDFAFLKGYLDDLSLGEHLTSTHYVSWTGELLLKEDLPPDYVEGFDMKELLHII